MKIYSSLRKFGLALVAVITTAGITPAQVFAQEHLAVAPSQAISAAVCLSDREIENFARIAPGITRGAQPSDKALKAMAKDGVKTIIDLRMNGIGTVNEEALTNKLGMKYVHIPMMLTTPSNAQVAQFLSVVNSPANLPVYIHCRQGADRTGTLCGIYRRKVQGWDFDKTYAEMREHHFKPFLFGMKDLVKNCPNQKFDLADATNAMTPNIVTEAGGSVPAVIAKLHPAKEIAGDLPSAAGMSVMSVDQ